MMPARIQRSRAKGSKLPPGVIYVGRGSIWGNPFSAPEPALAARMFRVWLTGGMRTLSMVGRCRKVVPGPLDERRQRILAEVGMLRGRRIACWCGVDSACHGDVLLDLAYATACDSSVIGKARWLSPRAESETQNAA